MRFSALLAMPIALVGLAVPAYAEDPGLTVTWPTTTDVPQPWGTYTFAVADAAAEPQGTLYAEWQGQRQEIPHSGDNAMTFAKGAIDTIKVIRCLPGEPEPVCTDTGVSSPKLKVYQELEHRVRTDQEVHYGPGDQALAIWERSYPGKTLNFAWSMRRVGGSVDIASGTKTVTLDDEGAAEILLPIPATASTGSYEVTADVATDIAPWGLYWTRDYWRFWVDATPPSRLSATLSSTALYPHRDGYRDTISLSGTSTDYADTRVDVVSSSGKVVRTFNEGYTAAPYVKFDGRTAGGAILPAGRYTMRVTRTDEIGNKGIVSRAFSISHKRLQKRTWTRTYKAAATVGRATVQACSTLRKPSLRGWAGSLGYYSRSKCSRDNADVVATTNGVYVPKAFQNRYGTYQVSFYGGGARGARTKYIVMGYLNTRDDFSHRIQGGAPVRNYAGKVVSAGNFVHDKATKPYVLWTAGLTDGSRYDVKSFTVKLTYTVLA